MKVYYIAERGARNVVLKSSSGKPKLYTKLRFAKAERNRMIRDANWKMIDGTMVKIVPDLIILELKANPVVVKDSEVEDVEEE